MLISYLVAALAGSSIVVARNINAVLARKTGVFQGTLVNYLTGLSASLLVFAVSSGGRLPTGLTLAQVPLWAWLGGLMGVLVVALSNVLAVKVSALGLTMLIFIGQMVAGMVSDQLSGTPVSPGKIAGGLLMLTGLYLTIHKRKKSST